MSRPHTQHALAAEPAEWPTTRRFARSQHGTDAAFPRDPEYAAAARRYARRAPPRPGLRRGDRLAALALQLLAIALAAQGSAPLLMVGAVQLVALAFFLKGLVK